MRSPDLSILIIDENRIRSAIIEAGLRDAGHERVTVLNEVDELARKIESIAPDVVAMPVGQGHQTFTRFASGRGENPIALIAPLTDAVTGELAWAATRVRVSRVGDPDGRLIMFAGGSREHLEGGR